ncbi:TPA: hypothetical protein SIA26_004585 [Aeromonas bestiarum]|nr:hypothetical protein [Aeromonas bestiarum]HEH9406991.1 hypothetical protein [Aeromonas bestiarum]
MRELFHAEQRRGMVEWWNGGWQRRRKGEWDVEKESSFRENDLGSVTLIEKSKGIWVDGDPSKSKGEKETNFLPIIERKFKTVEKPNNIKKDNPINFLPSIVEKSKVVANTNKSKGDITTNFLPGIVKNSKDAIVKNFRPGDLMYGTSSGRDENYLKKLEDYHKLNVVNSTTGNNNGNEWARKGVRNTRSMIINSYSDPVRSALSDEFDRLKKNGGDFRLSKLPKAISQAKIGRPDKYGFDFDGYQSVASTHDKLKISSKHLDEWLWWKRGSKSGIEMVAQQLPSSARRIHFILDGMNIGGVVNKDTRFFGDSITASELRYIYRHWDRLNGRVIFYRDGKVVTSPWEDTTSSHLWNNYHPKSKI